MSKVNMSLSAMSALNILGFLLEFEQDLKLKPDGQMMLESIKEYEQELSNKMTMEQLEQSKIEIRINILMGKAPDNAKRGSIFSDEGE